jgi:gliding motility-associated-like protein
VCVNSATSDLYLDGVDISSQLIPLSSNTAYSYAKVDITSGNHKLTSNNGLLASVYGFGGKESYGYSAGYSLNNAVTDDYDVTGITTKLCTDELLQFNEELASEVIGVEWELGDQTTSTELNPKKTYDAAGTYEVKMIVERRCRKDTIIKTIEVEDCIEEALWVPTAFSPNNDGINDLLYVRGLANDPFLFRVYNRYGHVVFETEDLSLGWDGRINGKIISSATFMYTLQGTVNDEAYFKKGNITLVK